MAADNKPTPQDVREQLKRMLESAEFKATDKQRKFLSFVVGETLEDRASRLKGYTIAVDVYGRTDNFDPQVDPVVRLEAGRLRRALERYYLKAGRNDPVRIEIPKGGYIPTFQSATMPLSSNPALASESRDDAPSTEPSIAVMPLINLNSDPEQAYFTYGLTEELTAELARYQDFQVIASHSTVRFKDQKVDPKKAGQDLGVRFLLAGSVRKYLKTIKVTIRLLDTSSGKQIWGESYKRDLTAANLFLVQEDIASSAVGAIADQYGLINRRLSKESRKKAPADFEVYDAVLRFYSYETEFTPEAFEKSLAAIEQAIRIDPEYGLAWAMYGLLHVDNHIFRFCEMEAPLDKALIFAQKGVTLAPANQLANVTMAFVYFHRNDKDLFLQHVEKAIALNPNSPYTTGGAGAHMMFYGEWDRGLALLKKGMKLNPYHPGWFHIATYMDSYRRGDYGAALAKAQKLNYPQFYMDPLMRAAALGQLGRQKEAKEAIEQLLKIEPNFKRQAYEIIGRLVKVDDLIDKIIFGLNKAGIDEFD